LVPLLQVGWRGVVEIDAGFRAHLGTIEDYKNTCSQASWETMMFYAKKLQANKTKVAFFSSTPQGGGFALMRHALVRFSRLIGVDLTWYVTWIPIPCSLLDQGFLFCCHKLTGRITVPKPRPGVFRITKNVHNILQGVSRPDQRISAKEKAAIIDWITENANRYWLSEGGPLRPPEEGGADIIIVSRPLCLLSKTPTLHHAPPGQSLKRPQWPLPAADMAWNTGH
jgi:hypothetical protein